jgi:hypothetical protein
MNLKELYTLETGQDVAPKGILGVGASFSNEYVEWLENRLILNADLPIVSDSLPLNKLYQWCKEEGYKISAELTVRADNIKPVIVECDSISSVEDFAEHIGNGR